MIAELTADVAVVDFKGKPFKILRRSTVDIQTISDHSIVLRYYGKLYRMKADDFDKLKDYTDTYRPALY
jgi:hypothetical protein